MLLHFSLKGRQVLLENLVRGYPHARKGTKSSRPSHPDPPGTPPHPTQDVQRAFGAQSSAPSSGPVELVFMMLGEQAPGRGAVQEKAGTGFLWLSWWSHRHT